jgi:hypothetical protein
MSMVVLKEIDEVSLYSERLSTGQRKIIFQEKELGIALNVWDLKISKMILLQEGNMGKTMNEKIKSLFFRIVCGNCGIIADFTCAPGCSDLQTERRKDI